MWGSTNRMKPSMIIIQHNIQGVCSMRNGAIFQALTSFGMNGLNCSVYQEWEFGETVSSVHEGSEKMGKVQQMWPWEQLGFRPIRWSLCVSLIKLYKNNQTQQEPFNFRYYCGVVHHNMEVEAVKNSNSEQNFDYYWGSGVMSLKMSLSLSIFSVFQNTL